MHRTNAWCLSIAILFAQTIYVVKAETAADNGGASEKQVQACHIQEFGAYNAVRDIARTAGVVIGMDAVRTGEDTTYTLNFSGGTVADLLNLFVSQAPGYNWEENEAGIIHVFREDGRVSLKDVVLSYPSSANKTRKEIWESLAERPEITAWLATHRCSRSELFNGKEFRGHNDPLSVSAGTMTVSQLLDSVALKSGVNFWALLQSQENSTCQIFVLLW